MGGRKGAERGYSRSLRPRRLNPFHGRSRAGDGRGPASRRARPCEDEPLSAIGPRKMASDERVDAFLTRPIDGEWPYLWIDATYPLPGSGLLANRERDKVRQGGRIVSVAVIIAVGINMDGRREVLGMAIGPSEAFRGLRGPAGATVPFTLLDGISAGSGAARAAWREAGHQRCARGHQGLGRTRAEHDLAALSGAFPEERSCACGQEQPTRRLRLRAAGPCDGENPMAQRRRPDAGQVAEALRADGASFCPPLVRGQWRAPKRTCSPT